MPERRSAHDNRDFIRTHFALALPGSDFRIGKMGRLGFHIRRILGVALLLALPTLSFAENAAPPRVTPALWRVHSGTSTVYLFGSLHILPSGYH